MFLKFFKIVRMVPNHKKHLMCKVLNPIKFWINPFWDRVPFYLNTFWFSGILQHLKTPQKMCGRSQRGFHKIFELWQRDVEYQKGYNPFQISVSFLWPLNTSENLWFSVFFRGYRNECSFEMGLIIGKFDLKTSNSLDVFCEKVFLQNVANFYRKVSLPDFQHKVI